jgi:hypothetical protein
MKRALFLALLLSSLSAPARAKQTEVTSGGRELIAHTRLAPVVVHRAFPPFKGQHVYQGRNRSP